MEDHLFKSVLWEGDNGFRRQRIAEYILSRNCLSFSISFFDKRTCCKAYTYLDRTYVVKIFPAIRGLVFGLKVPFDRRVSMISAAFSACFSDLAAAIP